MSFKLLPLDALKETVRVLMFGAYDRFVRADGTEGKGKAYGENNWEKVPNARERYYDASLRHLTSWFEGERNDPESGCHHLAHSICCNMFALALDLRAKVITPMGYTEDRIVYGVDFAAPSSKDDSVITAVGVSPSGHASILGSAMARTVPDEYGEALDSLNRFAVGKQAGYAVNIEVDTFALYSIELAPALAQAHLYPGLAAAQRAIRDGEILVCEHGAFVTSSDHHETMRITSLPPGVESHTEAPPGAIMIALPDSDHGFKRPRLVRLVAVRKRAKDAVPF